MRPSAYLECSSLPTHQTFPADRAFRKDRLKVVRVLGEIQART
jgi:hypothetical protein